MPKSPLFCISTHDLTRRSTAWAKADFTDIGISTHDLTRRSTEPSGVPSAPKWVFQLTTPQGGRPGICVLMQRQRNFNSRPHKEVDHRRILHHGYTLSFQLTTSQGGRPYEATSRDMSETFQLTTSQGGRLVHVAYTFPYP